LRSLATVGEDSAQAVDIVVNVFERTYRRALSAAVLGDILADNRHAFARRVVLINNVTDLEDAIARAQRLLDDGAIDEFHLVAEWLDRALSTSGLRRSDLEPLLHYSDGPLVAATLPGSPWFLYWDPEARLAEPCDWVASALGLMHSDPRVMIANPSWERPNADGRRPGVERESIEAHGEFVIGDGFSDQVFLASRAALAAPIYRQRCIADITYPAAHKARVFEARLAAHMRHNDRLRATSLAATYVSDTATGGSSYPPNGPIETARYVLNALTLRALRLSPWRPVCLRHTWL
jgi:hypothetical protein